MIHIYFLISSFFLFLISLLLFFQIKNTIELKTTQSNIYICLNSITKELEKNKKEEENLKENIIKKDIILENEYQFSWFDVDKEKIEYKNIFAIDEDMAYKKILLYINNNNTSKVYTIEDIHSIICLNEIEEDNFTNAKVQQSQKNVDFIRNLNTPNEYDNQYDIWEQ